MSADVVVRHTLGAYFYSNMTLGVVVFLHSPQTEVCPLCARVVLGITISIVVRCISRLSFLPDTTLDMLSIFTALRLKSVRLCIETLGSLSTTLGIVVFLCSPQIGVYLLHARVLSWLQLLALSSVASQESSLSPA